MGGIPLGLLVLFAPLLLSEGERGKKREREKERGCPPALVQFGLPMGGRAPPLVGCPLYPLWPKLAHYFPRGVPVTPRYCDKYPKRPETIPVSEYYHPIYQSLLLDHFETPRHVRDLIRDSEQTLVTKTYNS